MHLIDFFFVNEHTYLLANQIMTSFSIRIYFVPAQLRLHLQKEQTLNMRWERPYEVQIFYRQHKKFLSNATLNRHVLFRR